ncbi:Pycsar system effector family protein [Desertivirga xinjiangensis]|uniref:Pycsar system effector family protein n=1 Tax=Desertivirga xinjiangensis TaxID=539206 RepID=UPI00210B6A97|nr:Pycsar system effector family protein [Pedobacter xinjiangensis]
MNYTILLEQIKEHVTGLYRLNETSNLVYHNLYHTEKIVANAGILSESYQLGQKERFIVAAAAWFHDIGYLFNPANHETEGAERAEKFLLAKAVDPEITLQVKNAILATKLPQLANTTVEKIVADADLFHLGTPEFADLNKLVRKEAEMLYGQSINKEEWLKRTVVFLQNHEFQTEYARKHLSEQKQQNLSSLIKRLEKKGGLPALVSPFEHEEASPERIREDKPTKGIETMFRISSQNHQRLSDMADNKANIIITVNSIILSAVLSFLIQKIDSEVYLAYPTYTILMVSLTAIIFAILSTRPAITRGLFSTQEVDQKKANLLFFGNFHRMSLENYASSMQVAMDDKQYLYGMLIKDLHSQGVVLGKKYRLLRISYNVFMYGLIVSVISFLIASLIFS